MHTAQQANTNTMPRAKKNERALLEIRIEGVGEKLHRTSIRVLLVWAFVQFNCAIWLAATNSGPYPSPIVNFVLLFALLVFVVAAACIDEPGLDFAVKSDINRAALVVAAAMLVIGSVERYYFDEPAVVMTVVNLLYLFVLATRIVSRRYCIEPPAS